MGVVSTNEAKFPASWIPIRRNRGEEQGHSENRERERRKDQWELLQEEGGNDLTEYRKSRERIWEEEGID